MTSEPKSIGKVLYINDPEAARRTLEAAALSRPELPRGFRAGADGDQRSIQSRRDERTDRARGPGSRRAVVAIAEAAQWRRGQAARPTSPFPSPGSSPKWKTRRSGAWSSPGSSWGCANDRRVHVRVSRRGGVRRRHPRPRPEGSGQNRGEEAGPHANEAVGGPMSGTRPRFMLAAGSLFAGCSRSGSSSGCRCPRVGARRGPGATGDNCTASAPTSTTWRRR